jgi:hypothetical protein
MAILRALEALPPETLITSIISAVSILSGSIVGGICSYLVSKKTMGRTEKIRTRMLEENLKYEERKRLRRVCEYAGIIRLDICTALFQSIRSLKSVDCDKASFIYPIPINRNYSVSVSMLEEYFPLKELSYIYQLYGIIEKLNNDIKNFNINEKVDCEVLRQDYEMFLTKLYGDNFKAVINFDIDKVTYNELYDNELIKAGYRNVLLKLDEVCCNDKVEQLNS